MKGKTKDQYYKPGEYVVCSSCSRVLTESKQLKFRHCVKCGYACCFDCKRNDDDEIFAHNIVKNAKEVEIQKDELFFDQHVVDDESESEDSISKIIMSRPFIKNLKFKLRRAKQNIVYYFRKNELDHEEIFQDPDRREEVEVFGNQERLHPNSMKFNNEFMKNIAYEDDKYVDNVELHEYEDS